MAGRRSANTAAAGELFKIIDAVAVAQAHGNYPVKAREGSPLAPGDAVKSAPASVPSLFIICAVMPKFLAMSGMRPERLVMKRMSRCAPPKCRR